MNTTEAAALDVWIASEYESIKASLIKSNTFDPDTFHDAYLRLSDALTPEIGINLYRRLFDSIYAELRKNKVWQSFKTVNVQELFFALLKSDDETECEEETSGNDPDITISKIKKYARHNLSGDEYNLFCLRFEQDMTYQQIGLYIGKGKDFVKQHLDDTCLSIRTHFNQKAAAI